MVEATTVDGETTIEMVVVLLDQIDIIIVETVHVHTKLFQEGYICTNICGGRGF